MILYLRLHCRCSLQIHYWNIFGNFFSALLCFLGLPRLTTIFTLFRLPPLTKIRAFCVGVSHMCTSHPPYVLAVTHTAPSHLSSLWSLHGEWPSRRHTPSYCWASWGWGCCCFCCCFCCCYWYCCLYCCCCCICDTCCVQRQITVTACLSSQQGLLFLFVLQDSLLPSSNGILTAVQNKKAVTAYFASKQLLLFVFTYLTICSASAVAGCNSGAAAGIASAAALIADTGSAV